MGQASRQQVKNCTAITKEELPTPKADVGTQGYRSSV